MATLPKFSKAVCETRYRLAGPFYIDNVYGLGASKTHSNILERGFHNKCSMDTFVKLCNTRASEADKERVKSHVEQGLGLACPQLYIDIDDYVAFGGEHSRCRILGYDGLDRIEVMRDAGLTELYVQVITVGYYLRGLDCLSSFFNWLARGIRVEHRLIPFPIYKVI